jgi:hypothetical protein
VRSLVCLALVLGLSGGVLAKQVKPAPLGAEEIVARNVEARGGLEGWRNIDTMIWAGRLESDTAPTPSMAFTLQQARPNKTRFEVSGIGFRAMRIFDGARGYKVRARHEGGPDVQPFSMDEVRFAREAQGIEGPLIDYAAKGSSVSLVGKEKIEGHEAYHLSVHFSSGEHQEVWVDTTSFLDVRADRPSYQSSASATVPIYYRDFKNFNGLMIPTVMDIGVGTGRTPDRMIIERVLLNPHIDAQTFERPGAPRRQGPETMRARFNTPPPMRRVPQLPPAPQPPAVGVPASEPTAPSQP